MIAPVMGAVLGTQGVIAPFTGGVSGTQGVIAPFTGGVSGTQGVIAPTMGAVPAHPADGRPAPARTIVRLMVTPTEPGPGVETDGKIPEGSGP